MALHCQGNFMCLLRAKKDFLKGTRPQEYGVLLHNMAEDSICGTCVMEDGRFETIPWGKLKLAFKRIHESSYKIADSLKTACNLLYLAAKADHATLIKKIKDCERDYFAFMDAAYAERRNKRGAKRKLGETTTSQQKNQELYHLVHRYPCISHGPSWVLPRVVLAP